MVCCQLINSGMDEFSQVCVTERHGAHVEQGQLMVSGSSFCSLSLDDLATCTPVWTLCTTNWAGIGGCLADVFMQLIYLLRFSTQPIQPWPGPLLLV